MKVWFLKMEKRARFIALQPEESGKTASTE